MKSRHHAREIALQILYQFDGQPVPQGAALAGQLTYHFTHFNVPESLREFISQLVLGTLNEIKKLDEMLEKHASHWKVSRMSSVDRNLLRMAVFEMTHFKDMPRTIIIDEAVELAKQFGTSETPAFINGILDSIKVV